MAGYVDRCWRSADGLRLHARDYAGAAGEARLPVICLHGLTRNARDFEDVAPAIAAMGRRVLAVDVRGRGLSDWSPDPSAYIVPTYVGDVAAMTQALGVSRAVFVGTSMGGLITMALATMAPELVAGAVINDIGPELSPVGLARIAAYTGAATKIDTWYEAIDYTRRINAAAFPNYTPQDWAAFARRIFCERDGKPAPDYDPDISATLKATPANAAPPDLWPLFERLAQRPLLLVRGELSDLLDAETSDRMRDLAPGMRFAQVEGVGHAPMLTEPKARSAIESFLAETP
jgi:pimeloyl-ACP methyl ester carboxylesterase